MLRALVFLGAALLTIQAATAQDDDPAKWRAFRPSVLALTDCMAKAARNDATTIELAANSRWDEAIREAVRECQSELSQMIGAHDRTYGHGTGAIFARGPYRQDLPRALQERLKPDFEARLARQQQQVEEQRRVAAVAEQAKEAGRKLLHEAKEAHDTCLRSTARELVPYSDEPAATLVTVILTKCAVHETRRAELAVVALGVSKQAAQEALVEVMAETGKEWLAVIVSLRAQRQKDRLEVPPGRSY